MASLVSGSEWHLALYCVTFCEIISLSGIVHLGMVWKLHLVPIYQSADKGK